MEESKYLHAIDLSDELKCINLAHSGAIHSLFTLQIFAPQANPSNNPINLTEAELRACSPDVVPGPASPMMLFVYRNAFNKLYNKEVTKRTEADERRSEVEIQFELRRRITAPNSPSRLSALYLVQNNEDGRLSLSNMLGNVFTKPEVLEVDIINVLDDNCLLKADHRWYEEYYHNPTQEVIDNYWLGTPFNDLIPSWEYLLEGSIALSDPEAFDKIKSHALECWPERFRH